MSVHLTWPLTGRSEEMRLIEGELSDPDSSGIVICGAAGIGKSRLAREALSVAASNGYETRWTVGTSSARALPLGVFSQWMGATVTDTLQLMRGVIASLTAASPGATVLLGVDDAHLLDDLSTFVVHQLVQRGAAKVMLTVREGEPVPSATRELWKVGQFARLDMQPLSRDETTALLSATLGAPLAPDVGSRMWRLTRGNVLYLRNVVEKEFADERLTMREGYWWWIGDPVVPPSLVETIESRIGALSVSVGDVIDVLAIGEPIALASLTGITDPAAVEEADMRGLITLEAVDGGMQVRLAHPLYGEVRRTRTPPSRLRKLRGLVATDLAASDDRDDLRVVVRRAALSLDSDLEPDTELLVTAAKGAVCLADLLLADRLTDAAIKAGGGPEARFVRADALQWLGRAAEADCVLADINKHDLTAADQARLAYLRASNTLWGLADPDGAKQVIDDASKFVPLGPRGCIDAFLTVYWAAMGSPNKARESSKLVVLTELPNLVGAGTAWAMAAASGGAGRTAEAVAAAEAGYGVLSDSFDAGQIRFLITDGEVGALLLSGGIHESRQAAKRLLQQAADLPQSAQLLSTAVAGRAALGAGRLDKALSLLRPVVEVLTALGPTNGFGYRYRLPLTLALGMQGLADEAASAVEALENLQHPSWRYLDYERALTHAWVAACHGAVSEAIGTALTAADTARANGQFAAEVMCLQTATQFGDHSRASRLNELAAIVEGPRAGLAAGFAAALGAGEADGLDSVSQDFENMGDLIAAMDAAAHAAITFRRQGLRGSALRCSIRAEALGEQCGGASTPVLRAAVEPLPLTDREREIVMFVADGLSSREVADKLTVSVRTVESHIYRAMAKTGTTSREDLAALLAPHRPTIHD